MKLNKKIKISLGIRLILSGLFFVLGLLHFNNVINILGSSYGFVML